MVETGLKAGVGIAGGFVLLQLLRIAWAATAPQPQAPQQPVQQQPVTSAAPVAPVMPMPVVVPMPYMVPMAPMVPAMPVAPVAPVAPVQPVAPVAPVQPATPPVEPTAQFRPVSFNPKIEIAYYPDGSPQLRTTRDGEYIYTTGQPGQTVEQMLAEPCNSFFADALKLSASS